MTSLGKIRLRYKLNKLKRVYYKLKLLSKAYWNKKKVKGIYKVFYQFICRLF